MSNLREVRILVKRDETLRRVCKFMFSRQDASLYLIPYAANGQYYYGSNTMSGSEASVSFDCSEQFVAESVPKLSIHETGQVHVVSPNGRAGPLMIPPLADLRGQHVATVTVDSFAGLQRHEGPMRTAGAEIDFPLEFAEHSESGRLVIYVNGAEPRFVDSCHWRFDLRRENLGGTLYVGVAAKHQKVLRSGPQGGIVVLGGWNPNAKPGESLNFLYVRGV